LFPVPPEPPDTPTPLGGQFAPTHWTVVLTARGDNTVAREALEKLCRVYWPPIYAFVRRQGHSPHDAQDLTQEFFARLLEKNSLARVDRDKGRFRSFLLASVKHFLTNEWDKLRAEKRGGGKVIFSIDAAAAESSCCFEIADPKTAEKTFERQWAMALLEQTLVRLRTEYAREGKEKIFEQLKGALTGDHISVSYAVVADRLKTTEGAVKVMVHRLRQRYRELMRSEIASTVATPAEIDEELQNLFAALSN
jgi:RNA polymerase sigma factor (sigma-70 family)